MTRQLIPWNDGNGNIVLTYESNKGNGTITVTSDTDNLGDDRSQTLIFRTLVGDVETSIVVTQPTGMQVLIVRTNTALAESQDKILRVYPPGYVPRQ